MYVLFILRILDRNDCIHFPATHHGDSCTFPWHASIWVVPILFPWLVESFDGIQFYTVCSSSYIRLPGYFLLLPCELLPGFRKRIVWRDRRKIVKLLTLSDSEGYFRSSKSPFSTKASSSFHCSSFRTLFGV